MFDINPLKRNSQKETKNAQKNLHDSSHPHESSVAIPLVSKHVNITATIGPTICVKGDLSGEEDLLIQGRVEGTINLKQNLIVGQQGEINANIYARTITVEGTVKGDMYGEERVIIKDTGNVQGNVTAPRVSLEEGAIFKGSIDMDDKAVETKHHERPTASVFKLDKATSAEKAPSVEKSTLDIKRGIRD